MTEQEIDKLQEFIESNLHSDVPDEIYNKIMSDAETLEMDQFNKTWDSYLRDHSVGWKKERTNTDPLSKQVADAFNDNLNPSDNWIYENFPGVDPKLIKTELEKLRTEKAKKDNEKKKVDEQKAKETERYARQKAVDNYEHSYLGMDLDNPINKAANWLADHVISDDTKRAIVEDPNNSSGIWANAAADIGGTTLDFAPGYWSLLGTGSRAARDIANDRNGADILKRNWLDAAIGVGGAKLMKGMKAKGVSDDAIDVSEKASGLGGEAKQAVTDMNKARDKVKTYILTSAISKFRAKNIRKMSPEEWQKFIKDIPDPSTRELLKSVGYENRTKLNDVVKQLDSELDNFVNNDLARANLYWKEHPNAVKVAEVITKAEKPMKQVSVGLSKTTSSKGLSETPYKTSDPNKATFKREQDVIDWYKDNYGDQWRAGFKPRQINGELMMKAWQEGHDAGQW